MKNINDLRTALFETMQGVKDGTVDKDRARAITDIGQVIVNTAKVEVDFIKATGETAGTGFVALSEDKGGTEIVDDENELPDGITRIVRHRIAG